MMTATPDTKDEGGTEDVWTSRKAEVDFNGRCLHDSDLGLRKVYVFPQG